MFLFCFIVLFDVGCPQGSVVPEVAPKNPLKKFNCNQILFDRGFPSSRN